MCERPGEDNPLIPKRPLVVLVVVVLVLVATLLVVVGGWDDASLSPQDTGKFFSVCWFLAQNRG